MLDSELTLAYWQLSTLTITGITRYQQLYTVGSEILLEAGTVSDFLKVIDYYFYCTVVKAL